MGGGRNMGYLLLNQVKVRLRDAVRFLPSNCLYPSKIHIETVPGHDKDAMSKRQVYQPLSRGLACTKQGG